MQICEEREQFSKGAVFPRQLSLGQFFLREFSCPRFFISTLLINADVKFLIRLIVHNTKIAGNKNISIY